MNKAFPEIFVDFSPELLFRTARSGGKGGQNVNKVETLVEAMWIPADSRFFTAEEKTKIAHRLMARVNSEGYLTVRCSKTRSQLENKELAVKKILELVNNSLIDPKKRKATKPPAVVKENRLLSKKRQSEKKEGRKKPSFGD